ncbi:MAG TPA: hypothetical protein DCY07_05555, partial [Rhodospirillaceae bacterium]|nr:hypothetical protein [Rhodospirillaceae bacterium]
MNMPITVVRNDLADVVPVFLDGHYSADPLSADEEKTLFLERLKMQEQKLGAVLKIPSALKLIRNHYHRLTTQKQSKALFVVRGETNALNGFSQKAKKNRKVQVEHACLIVDLCDHLLVLQDRAYKSTGSTLEENVAQTDAPRRFLLETMVGAYPFRSFWDKMSEHMDSVGGNTGKYNSALRPDFDLAALDFYAAAKREKQIEHTVAQSNTRWVYEQLQTVSKDPAIQSGFLSDGM